MKENISKFEKCPNCDEAKHLDLEDCPYCGVVYKKIVPKGEDFGPSARIDLDLHALWSDLLEDYKNHQRHEEFIHKALAKNNLPYASQQYRKLLEVNPQDEIAKQMQKKIINLATVKIMSQKRDVPVKKKAPLLNLLLIVGFSLVVLGLISGSNASVLSGFILFSLHIVAAIYKKKYAR